MFKKHSQSFMPLLWVLAAAYVILAQFATIDNGLHSFLHGKVGQGVAPVHSDCDSCHDETGKSPKHQKNHQCFVTLLASGLMDASLLPFDFVIPELALPEYVSSLFSIVQVYGSRPVARGPPASFL